MSNVPLPPTPPQAPALARWLLIATRVARFVLVVAFVLFNLVVLAVRNPLDLFEKEIIAELRERPSWGGAAAADPDATPPTSYYDDEKFRERFQRADEVSDTFTRAVGCEQNWCMFRPRMARDVYFLAIRLEFADGSSELIYSDNEPEQRTRYFRAGGWQMRKLETELMKLNARRLHDPHERKFWEQYARYKLRKWRQARPNDPRELQSIVFVRRTLYFPAPGKTVEDVAEPSEDRLAEFDAEGRNGRLAP